MLHFAEQLSPRHRFWLGFMCCPLIVWMAVVAVALLLKYDELILVRLPQKSPYIGGLFMVSELVFLCGIPASSGFCAAFFWRSLKYAEGSESNAGFWSVAVAWLPSVVIQSNWLSLFYPFLIFIVIYVVGLTQGRRFWNSNRARQWFGDFSDLGSRDDAQTNI